MKGQTGGTDGEPNQRDSRRPPSRPGHDLLNVSSSLPSWPDCSTACRLPIDPPFAGVTLVLTAVALAASYIHIHKHGRESVVALFIGYSGLFADIRERSVPIVVKQVIALARQSVRSAHHPRNWQKFTAFAAVFASAADVPCPSECIRAQKGPACRPRRNPQTSRLSTSFPTLLPLSPLGPQTSRRDCCDRAGSYVYPRKSGRLLHCRFRGLLSVHSRYGLHARQVA